MITTISLLLLGLVILIKGADWFVDGSSALAKKFNVSDLVIGLTVVAFGTSAPELVVNSMASADSQFGIVFGNIIGSNNFNLFMILGISGLIYPIAVQKSTVWKEIPISLFAAILVLIVVYFPTNSASMTISRWDAVILLVCFFSFLFYVYKQLGSENSVTEEQHAENESWLKIVGFIVVGLVGLIFGGRLVLDNAVLIAQLLGVSDKIIGLTIVAAGTSLPELATSVMAAIKKNNDIAVGNIIGSNIFNIFLILGVSGLIQPLQYDAVFNRDVFLLIGGTIFLFSAMFISQKKTLDRWEAAVLLIVFVIYTGYLISNA